MADGSLIDLDLMGFDILKEYKWYMIEYNLTNVLELVNKSYE